MTRPIQLREDETFVLNLGPQHPATHGVLRVKLTMDGEYIVLAEPVLGYIHRMHEKLAEGGTFAQFMPNTARMDYLHALAFNHGWALVVERAAGIEVPERAEYIRVITVELNRIASHLLWWAAFLLDLGGFTHLFSFFPEKGSLMENVNPPSLGTYRRIQLARYLIDEKMIEAPQIQFDANGRIVGFDMSADLLDRIINEGSAFETSGCPGPDGKTACNRPYGNEKPGSEIRNFPFQPDETDIRIIKSQIWEY